MNGTSFRRRLVVVSFVLAGLAGCDGCKDEPPSERAEAPSVTADTGAPDAGSARPYLEMRQAFGLPIPPDVVSVRKSDGFIVVHTDLRSDEVEGFFRSRLVDYGFFRPHKTKLEIVGLRSYMPRVTVTDLGRRAPTQIRYGEAEEPPEQSPDGGIAEKPRVDRTKGAPVELRTKDGSLLAPGARWGEPYTPPPGSPLHQKRYRANFGKPFGEWILN